MVTVNSAQMRVEMVQQKHIHIQIHVRIHIYTVTVTHTHTHTVTHTHTHTVTHTGLTDTPPLAQSDHSGPVGRSPSAWGNTVSPPSSGVDLCAVHGVSAWNDKGGTNVDGKDVHGNNVHGKDVRDHVNGRLTHTHGTPLSSRTGT